MDVVEFREYCLGKPNTTEGTPFGETVLVFKVAGKMFALISLDEVPATARRACAISCGAIGRRSMKCRRLPI